MDTLFDSHATQNVAHADNNLLANGTVRVPQSHGINPMENHKSTTEIPTKTSLRALIRTPPNTYIYDIFDNPLVSYNNGVHLSSMAPGTLV